MLGMLKSLWSYRQFVASSIIHEFKVRFARSRIGAFWMILQPLSQVLIYALILSTVMAAKLPGINNRYSYALYLMSGTLAWSLFSEIVTRCLTLFIDQANLIKKMQFPRIALPAIVVGSALINNLMLFVAIMLIFAVFGHFPTIGILYLPALMLATVAFSVGVGLTLGVINVFIRDLTHVVPIALQLVFWATPVVYPIAIIPDRLQYLLAFNPLIPLVNAYQQLLLNGIAPDLQQLGTIMLLSCALLGFGFFVFRRAGPEMVDVL